MGPLPGTKWDPSLGQTGLSLLNSTVKSPFCPVCPWDGWGFVPGTIVPQGPSENVCVFCLLFFVAPNGKRPKENKKKKPFCTFVVARLSSFNFSEVLARWLKAGGAECFRPEVSHLLPPFVPRQIVFEAC